jgi:hypothetical protein
MKCGGSAPLLIPLSVPTWHVRSQIGLLDPVDLPNLQCFCSVNNTKVSLPKLTFYFVHEFYLLPLQR